MTKSEIMKRAWKLIRKYQANWGGSYKGWISSALRNAHREAIGLSKQGAEWNGAFLLK